MPLLYLVVVTALTWPLAARITTSLSGRCGADCLLTAWALSHESHALATDPGSLAAANMYHPEPHSLFYVTTGFGALPVFAPVFLWSGNPALATNVLFLTGLVLTAWALHLVVHRWTGSHLAGLVAAVTLLTTRFFVSWAMRAPFYSMLVWMPLIAYFAAQLPKRRRAVVLLAALVSAQAWVDPVYCTLAVSLPLAVLVCVRMVRAATRPAAFLTAAAVAVAGLSLAPVYAGYAAVLEVNPNLFEQTVWHRKPWLALPPLRWLAGQLAWGLTLSRFPLEMPWPAVATIAVGLASAGIGLLRGSPVRAAMGWGHGLLWAVVGMVAGIVLRRRVGMAGLVGGAMLSGVAFSEIQRRLAAREWSTAIGRGLPAAVAVALVAAMIMSAPAWIGTVRQLPATADDELIRVLRANSGPVLELPIGPGRGPHRHATAMYRSIFHRRPILNGYGSYFPAAFPDRMALAERLPDPVALATLQRTTGLTTIVTHHRSPETRLAWDRATHRPHARLRLVWQGAGTRVFELAEPPGSPGR